MVGLLLFASLSKAKIVSNSLYLYRSFPVDGFPRTCTKLLILVSGSSFFTEPPPYWYRERSILMNNSDPECYFYC
jgi:hypothetical protein